MDQMDCVLSAFFLSVGCAVAAFFFLRAYREKIFVGAFWLKGLASILFVAVGAIGVCCSGEAQFSRMVLIGLVLGFLGDQLLAMRLIHEKQHDLFFTAGALSFAVGHVLYIVALSTIEALKVWIVLPVFLVGSVLSLRYAAKNGTNVGEKTPLAVAYVAIVLFMASVAVNAAVLSRSIVCAFFAVGGILFCISDNILCAYCYGKKPVWRMNRDLHIAYYAAQLLIAWSIMVV